MDCIKIKGGEAGKDWDPRPGSMGYSQALISAQGMAQGLEHIRKEGL